MANHRLMANPRLMATRDSEEDQLARGRVSTWDVVAGVSCGARFRMSSKGCMRYPCGDVARERSQRLLGAAEENEYSKSAGKLRQARQFALAILNFTPKPRPETLNGKP